MSVELLRDDALAIRRHELRVTARGHRAALRQLRGVTDALTKNDPIAIFKSLRSAVPSKDTPSDDVSDGDDSLSVRYFDEDSLPFPHIPQDASIYAPKPNRAPTHSPRPTGASSVSDGRASEDVSIAPTETAASMAIATDVKPGSSVNDPEAAVPGPVNDLQHPVAAEGPAVSPVKAAPPLPEDQAAFSDATKELVASESPQRPAKTVHLPPRDVQEERLRERHEAEHDARRKSEAERSSRSHPNLQADMASSPSSTIGPYSAATPMPAQDSDTSPDSETAAPEETIPPKDLAPSSQEREAQEEHDRLLEAQKELARKEALGEPTPDDQLNWEARAAAAREREEREAHEASNGPEADAKRPDQETEAEEVMEGVEKADAQQLPITPAPSHDERSAGVPAAVSDTKAVDEDGDNITVTPRIRPPSLQAQEASPRQKNLSRSPRSKSPETARRSTTSLPRQPSQNLSASPVVRQLSTPEPGSPTTRRQPAVSQTSRDVAFQTPQRPARQAPLPPSGPAQRLTLEDLAPLQGLSEDPDRDYLESLFRIQAHDSPNSQTRSLPELVKSAGKYISTEDQFTQLHERIDYRILRRIYQLQNANRWSLRQMERVKEPEQPVSHMDHMMAEMRWMRRDFKAERKMKKSVCAWLAARCAEWVAAGPAERTEMQVKVRKPAARVDVPNEDHPPELEASGDSGPEDDHTPATPKLEAQLPRNLIIAPELSETVADLQKCGKLAKALQSLPIVGLKPRPEPRSQGPLTAASKYVEGKVFPVATGFLRKRSRFDYEDDAELLNANTSTKRLRHDRDLPAEDEEVALFHPDNKHIRDRLHANNAFRPPSEFAMPATSFYEFRNGSQWIWEDDQKLRKLAKEYTFNWSLIADEMALPTRYKSSAERRTPWECFERWVELEQLPAEMRKTMYFKTWFLRLEQSQQAADRRYQAQVAVIQAQAQNGQQPHIPQRRRTTPSRVEKRKNTRYLWLVDCMRKNAKKRENNAYKQAEAQRAAAQRKSANENNTPQRQGPRMTPQDFSKKRQERDAQIAEAQRLHRQKLIEAQRQQALAARQAAGQTQPPRPITAGAPPQHAAMPPNGAPHPNMNGHFPQQARPPLQMTTKNGHLAVPQVNAQGIPQPPMPAGQMTAQQQQQQMARIAHANAQRSAAQYGQQYQMPHNGALASPGSGMTTQQQLQHNQALLAQMQNQQHGQGQGNNHNNGQGMSASPSMPPPPTPHQQPQQPGQLSSGHVPALIAIKNQLRAKHPGLTEDQYTTMATNELQRSSQTSNQARQNAMNAAAGLQPQQHTNNMQQAYGHNQQAFRNNTHLPNANATYMNGANMTSANGASHPSGQLPTSSPQAAVEYANRMRQQAAAQMMPLSHQSPNGGHAQLNGSPALAQASPAPTPASPAMAYAGMQGGGRPPSRNTTPGMQRMGSSGSVPGVGAMATGMQSPGAAALQQGSPRNLQASMAR